MKNIFLFLMLVLSIPTQNYEKAIFGLLGTSIEQSLKNHYPSLGPYTKDNIGGYTHSKIVAIQTEGDILITVSFETFYGAHNPPYYENIITYRLSSNGIDEQSFKQQEIFPPSY